MAASRSAVQMLKKYFVSMKFSAEVNSCSFLRFWFAKRKLNTVLLICL